MSDSDFTIEGWDEFVERFSNLVYKWEEKKAVLLTKMGNMYHSEVIPLVPIDTSRLVDSISVGGIVDDIIEVGTNVEYALFVNDGHVQHKRFLPCRKITVDGKTRLVHDRVSKMGVMLQERYVAGSHFMEKGMTNAKPRFERLIESFYRDIFRELEGGKL